MMKLGEDITIMIGGEAVRLVPRLRHALALERRPGSFKAVLDAIEEGSLTVAAEIIRPHHPHPMLLNRVFDAGLDRLKPALFAYVAACAGIDETAPQRRAKAKASGKPLPSVPFSEHLAGLYRIGTGWLGWTPDVTLDATPTEIRLAYEGRVEMLRAVFGSSEEEKVEDGRDFGEKFAAFARARSKRETA